MLKSIYQFIYESLWENDPAFLRLKHALKTTLAVALTVIIMFPASIMAKFAAGFAAGFSMQGIIGETRRERLKLMLIADACYFIAYLLGSLLQNNKLLIAITLTVLGFLVMYVRRFGPKFNSFPMFIWLFCFTGSITPHASDPEILQQELIGIVIGTTVAMIIYLTIFPTNQKELYLDNLKRFFTQYTAILIWLRRGLTTALPPTFSEQQSIYLIRISKLIHLNQEAAAYLTKANPVLGKKIAHVSIKQYALAKALAIILVGVKDLNDTNIQIDKHIRNEVIMALKEVINSLRQTTIDDENILALFCGHEMLSTLHTLEQDILSSSLYKRRELIYLINIYLGIKLIRKNLQHAEPT